ncbi:MAG: phosphoribosylglycinamide formyltransferase [Ferruginibacter sp.]
MFQKLQRKWKVNSLSLLLILVTFATGGSLCGYLGKKILGFTGLEKNFLWFLLYIILITLLWPLCVLLISIPLGQFPFFKKYISKIIGRMSGKKRVRKIRLAIFASGAGSNAQKIIEHFSNDSSVEVSLVVCNKPEAGVLHIANTHHIETLLIERERFFKGDAYIHELQQRDIDYIILAGFLWKIPAALVKAWPSRIINIHPALLPKYGGKGMYGHHVHDAVIAAGEKESGITIHYVDEIYDNGKTIFQATCTVEAGDTPASLAQKIHQLEHRHFPEVIASLLKKNS